MKITKRIISVILALLLVFGSFSSIAFAAPSDEITITFKYFREEAGEWIETTKVARGDTIKARMYIKTNFIQQNISIMYAYPKDFMTHDFDHLEQHPSNVLMRWFPVNSENAQVQTYDIKHSIVNNSEILKDNMMDDGGGEYEPYLTQEFFDKYGWINTNAAKYASAFAYDDSDWVGEFQFTVSDTAEGNGFMFIPVESIIDPDFGVAAYTNVINEDGIEGTSEYFTWNVLQPEDMTEEDMLSVTQKVKFAAGANGTISGTTSYEGYIGDKLSAIDGFAAPAVSANAGYKFVGWSDGETTYENAADFVVDYDEVTLTAVYETTAAPTAEYTVNVYEMDVNGNYGDPATSTLTGEIDAEVSYTYTDKEGFYLDTAKSTADLKTTVKADDTDVIDVYVARNAMTVKYVDENGNAIASLPDATYYYGATYTLADAISKEGYDWAGWEAGKAVEAKPAANGEDVTYKAAYTAAKNQVVINAYYDDAKFGGTVDLDPYTVETKTGYTVKIVNELPAEQEANVTYVLKSALPAAEHYEVDPDAEYTVEVKADGSATLEIAYVSKAYVVKFIDADGNELYNRTHEYYDLVDAPGAPDLSAEGKFFEAWVAVDGEGDDIADEYGSIEVEGSVTYQATYYDEEYYAFYSSEEVEGWDAPALDEIGLSEEEAVNCGDKVVLPDLTDKVTGYEFLGYEVIDAEYDEETRTVTFGAKDADIIVLWDRIEYTVNYYLTEDTTGEPYKSVDRYYGDEVAAVTPEQAEILGQKFIDWTYTPALVDGRMPAENVVATMNAQPYVVAFYNANGSLAGETGGATITADAAAAYEAAATPANTTFVEWRDADGKAVAFPVSVMSDINVYAYCTATVTFMVNDAVYSTATVGYGESVTAPEIAADYLDGYTFTGWSEIPAAITENTIVVANFTANTYTATFNAAAGAFEGGAKEKTVENITYNTEFTFDDVPVLDGSTFAGWSEDGTTIVDTLVMDAEGKTYTAIYTENGKVNYTVEIYLMGTDGKYAEAPTKTDVTKSQTIGLLATAAHADYAQEAWFSADETAANITSAEMTADGATLKLYYARAQYDVTVDGEPAGKVYHGAEFIAPSTSTTTKAGYELANWNDGAYTKGQAITVEAPLALVANNVAVDSTYTVELYLMNTEGGYGAPVIKTETAKTDAVVSKTHADYPQDAWFSAAAEGNDATDKAVAADGSTVLKLYYTRAQYDVTVDGESAGKVYHGAEFIAPSTSTTTKAGYELANWNDGAYTKGQAIIVEAPLALVANNVASANTYKVEIYLMDTEGNYGAAADTDTINSVTDAEVTASHADYAQKAWFSADVDKSTLTGVVAADGSTTLKLYYKRAQYEVTVDGEKAADVFHDATFTAPATSTKVPAGYHIIGWTDGTTNYSIGEEITVTAPLALTVKYEADTNTAYTVEIYTMDTTGAYGTPATETKYDETGKVITFAPDAAAEGFYIDTEKCELETTVSSDNSDVIKVYYGREKFAVTVDGVKVADAYYEATFTAPETSTTTEAGYELASWNNGTYAKGEEITVKGALDLTADNVAIKYDVVFKINDSVYASTKLAFGTAIESAGTPADEYIPEGYSFKGWSTDGATVIDNFGTVAVGGNTFLAVLEINKYELSFVVDGEVVEGYPVEVEYNSAIAAPKAPDKSADGLTFAGWVEADNESAKMPAKMPAKDVTYVATYVESGAKANYIVEVYHMNFDGEYELSASTTLSAHVGETVDVQKGDVSGFTFSDADSVLSAKVLADGSTVLKVCYARNLYKATFDGVAYDVYFGQALPTVEPAAQEGKEFKGWAPEVPVSMPAEDLTFTSTWEDAKYTVTYYVNGETTEVEYVYGATIEAVEDPSVEGMEFTGWTGLPADGKMPAKDIIVIANFKAAVYNVTFQNADGSVFKKNAVKFGDDIIVPTEEPTLEYHNFVGWSGIPADGKMPARDVDVTPIFEAIPVMLIPKNDTCTTVIDRNGETTADFVEGESEWYIYGLDEVIKDTDLLAEYIDVQGDGRIEIVFRERIVNNWAGTGTVVNVYDNNTDELVESFTIVIFGDLNGDSYVTAIDWSIAEDEVAYITEWSDDTLDTYNAAMVMAADFDRNGIINATDAGCISSASLGLSEIDQVEGKVIDL